MTSFSILDNIEKKSRKIEVKFGILLKILWKMEHLLLGANAPFSITFSRSKCSIFHNNFKYIVYFKGAKRRYHGVKGKNCHKGLFRLR